MNTCHVVQAILVKLISQPEGVVLWKTSMWRIRRTRVLCDVLPRKSPHRCDDTRGLQRRPRRPREASRGPQKAPKKPPGSHQEASKRPPSPKRPPKSPATNGLHVLRTCTSRSERNLHVAPDGFCGKSFEDPALGGNKKKHVRRPSEVQRTAAEQT